MSQPQQRAPSSVSPEEVATDKDSKSWHKNNEQETWKQVGHRSEGVRRSGSGPSG
jgi:hypothetical protein